MLTVMAVFKLQQVPGVTLRVIFGSVLIPIDKFFFFFVTERL